MKNRLSTTGLGIAVFALFGFQPAEAGCQLIHATHSARSQAKAVETSRALALGSAHDLQRAMGWRHITMTAHPVQGDPFWKAVRPKGVPAHARLGLTWLPLNFSRLVLPASLSLTSHYGFERLRPITRGVYDLVPALPQITVSIAHGMMFPQLCSN